MNGLAAIRNLHEDLAALSEVRLPNIEGLCLSLESHLGALKKLLDKKPQNDQSKQALDSGIRHDSPPLRHR